MPRKSSKNGKAGNHGKGNNGNLQPAAKGEVRNPQGINGFVKLGQAVVARMGELVPVELPEGQTTLIKRHDLFARQLVKGAMDYGCETCSEKQHHIYLTEVLKRYWPVPREDKPVVPIQIVVQAGPQETFVKQVLAKSPNGPADPDIILDALVDTSEGGNGKPKA